MRWRRLCALGKGGEEYANARWVLQTEHGLQKTGKEKENDVWPGPKKCKAGHEANNCGELRVKRRGPCALKGDAEHERAKVGVSNRALSPEDRERERK